MGERTGSRVFQWVWSYVMGCKDNVPHNFLCGSSRAFKPAGKFSLPIYISLWSARLYSSYVLLANDLFLPLILLVCQ
ncbi:hypothetical protein CTRU02_200672 [Colletotrichum truncatum]|uniref:Uncharacterized protein n=1 Tax=Colletotrichum truncatum TaxID=5467 RepID=A0ACC3ZF84_COLTU